MRCSRSHGLCLRPQTGKYGHLHVEVHVVDMKGRSSATHNKGRGIHPDTDFTLKCQVSTCASPPLTPHNGLLLLHASSRAPTPRPPQPLLARIALTHTHVSLRGGINTFVLLVLVSPPCSSSSHLTCFRLALHMFPHAVHTCPPIRYTHLAAAHMS